MDLISKTFNEIMNAMNAGKFELEASPVSNLLIDVLKIMKDEGYIDYSLGKKKSSSKKGNGEFPSVKIKVKRLNECRAIRPRFHFQSDELEKYLRRYLPSRDLGIVIVSTDKGLMNHREAVERGFGGILLAYCY